MNLLFALFSTFVATASANCNPNGQPNNGQCEEYGGQCSKAADIFLNQIGIVSKAPQNVLSYGRYCGAATKCPGLGPDNGSGKGKDGDKGNPNAVEVCADDNSITGFNTLDTACVVHDTCLGDLDQIKGFEGRTPQQCLCDATLLGTLLTVAVTDILSPDDKLCDENFYDEPVLPDPFSVGDISYSAFLSGVGQLTGQTIYSPEAILLAAPFCGLFVAEGDCEGLAPTDLTLFCTTLFGVLTSL